MKDKRNKRGFTLIELLIVVAIIAILAAIAVPNFLEAQVRAKVSRAKADLRSTATALESYYVDNNNYPIETSDIGAFYLEYIKALSTPVAYLSTTMLLDPFMPDNFQNWEDYRGSYSYMSFNGPFLAPYYPDYRRKVVSVISFGPDRVDSHGNYFPYFYEHPERGLNATYHGLWPAPAYEYMMYDSSNGTVSPGDIIRVCGEATCPQAVP